MSEEKTIIMNEFTSKGEVFVNANGEVTRECFNLFRDAENPADVYLRIGDNMYVFYDGKYDGSEHNIASKDLAIEVTKHLEETMHNKGKLPETTYYPEGSPGWKKEMG